MLVANSKGGMHLLGLWPSHFANLNLTVNSLKMFVKSMVNPATRPTVHTVLGRPVFWRVCSCKVATQCTSGPLIKSYL
jgi:hypothetical protein